MTDEIKIHTQEQISQVIFGKLYHSTQSSIFILKDGNISMKKNGKTVNITRGTLLIINTTDICEFISISNDIELRIILFHKSFVSKITFDFHKYDAFQLIVLDKYLVFKVSDFEIKQLWILTEALQNFLNQQEESYFRVNIIQNIFLSICYHCIDILIKGQRLQKSKTNRREMIVIDFLRLLSEYFKETRDVGFYAEKLRITSRYLSANLKLTTGYTANDLINKFIVIESEKLLNSTKKTINEIATELHFSDQYHFSNFFKRHTGMNPTLFRNDLKEE